MEIMGQCQKPGLLQDRKLVGRLIYTVRNAINLARLLGERYLWVGSLCFFKVI